MKNSHIQWTDHTFNPWEGCTKVSPGCAHCYAEARNKRFGGDNWGKGKPRRRTSAGNWQQPLKWNRDAGTEAHSYHHNPQQARFNGEAPHRPRVFCASLADWLDEEVPIEWLADFLKLIRDTPNLDWLALSKRPENFECRTLEAIGYDLRTERHGYAFNKWLSLWSGGTVIPSNVWIGTSIEDQKRADERIPELLKIPAKVRFLSCEPLLGPIYFPHAAPCGYYCDHDEHGGGHRPGHGLIGIHWVIFGGESGAKARPCDVGWIRDGVQQCRAAGVSPFVKQLGTRPYEVTIEMGDAISQTLRLHDSKGGDWNEWPEDLRVREWPVVVSHRR